MVHHTFSHTPERTGTEGFEDQSVPSIVSEQRNLYRLFSDFFSTYSYIFQTCGMQI